MIAGGANWGAIGAMAAAAMKEKTPVQEQTELVRELREKVESQAQRIRTLEAREKSLEEYLSKANATIDDQAAQIVALEATAQLRPAAGITQLGDVAARYAAADAAQRKNIAIAEARVLQLIEAMRGAGMDPPLPEPMAAWNR